jgi:hypothetical protein
VARSYATGSGRGSAGSRAADVWLAGNVRPAVGLALVAAAAGLAAVAVQAVGVAGWLAWLLLGLAVGLGLAAVVLAVAAGRPRLACGENAVIVRLSPWRAEAVPLDVVECVFPGSQPLTGPALEHSHDVGPSAGPPATRRVGTLVIRLAERAVAWRSRTTFPPWGVWDDGHIVIDGRWCEPLSPELARSIGERLVAAKRGAAEPRP